MPSSSCAQGAYPRSHGATRLIQTRGAAPGGLSPLARGNQLQGIPRQAAQGPIPARTGQPDGQELDEDCTTAYPRSHGATGSRACPRTTIQGLSPLARGNRSNTARIIRGIGPIPARTGQPPRSGGAKRPVRAYPRSHGATLTAREQIGGVEGLSPLARGNRFCFMSSLPCVGPIPARTGQPIASLMALSMMGAYPRSHGATRPSWMLYTCVPGLSPLARGNQHAGQLNAFLHGPIPARTGQPLGALFP